MLLGVVPPIQPVAMREKQLPQVKPRVRSRADEDGLHKGARSGFASVGRSWETAQDQAPC